MLPKTPSTPPERDSLPLYDPAPVGPIAKPFASHTCHYISMNKPLTWAESLSLPKSWGPYSGQAVPEFTC